MRSLDLLSSLITVFLVIVGLYLMISGTNLLAGPMLVFIAINRLQVRSLQDDVDSLHFELDRVWDEVIDEAV